MAVLGEGRSEYLDSVKAKKVLTSCVIIKFSRNTYLRVINVLVVFTFDPLVVNTCY
jgi:hypothetical protein